MRSRKKNLVASTKTKKRVRKSFIGQYKKGDKVVRWQARKKNGRFKKGFITGYYSNTYGLWCAHDYKNKTKNKKDKR